jgi:hypothetical protein
MEGVSFAERLVRFDIMNKTVNQKLYGNQLSQFALNPLATKPVLPWLVSYRLEGPHVLILSLVFLQLGSISAQF